MQKEHPQWLLVRSTGSCCLVVQFGFHRDLCSFRIWDAIGTRVQIGVVVGCFKVPFVKSYPRIPRWCNLEVRYLLSCWWLSQIGMKYHPDSLTMVQDSVNSLFWILYYFFIVREICERFKPIQTYLKVSPMEISNLVLNSCKWASLRDPRSSVVVRHVGRP